MLSSTLTSEQHSAMAGGFLKQDFTLFKYTEGDLPCSQPHKPVLLICETEPCTCSRTGPDLVVLTGISFLLGGAPWCHGSYRILLCHDKAVSVQRCKSVYCFLLYLSSETSCQQCLFQSQDVILCNQPAWSY